MGLYMHSQALAHAVAIVMNYEDLSAGVGTLPASWAALRYLQILYLGKNRISGKLRSYLDSGPDLKHVNYLRIIAICL